MPKKKEEKVEIINYYEKMPKKFLLQTENPNIHLHGFKIPMRACIVAPSGSGKTNFLLNMLHLFSKGEGTWGSLHIITANANEPLYDYLKSKNKRISIKEGLGNLPILDEMDKEINNLVVLDDLVLSKNLSAVETYYVRARKMNTSVIFISQSYFRIPKIIRNNCSYMILLKLSGHREVNMILKDFGLGVSKEQLLQMYQYATNEKFSPLILDLEQEPNKRFRKGFQEILDPNMF